MSRAGKQRLHRARAASLALFALLMLRVPFASGQAHAQVSAEFVHGADSLFVTPDVAIVWAVLKQPASDHATVWLRIGSTFEISAIFDAILNSLCTMPSRPAIKRVRGALHGPR